MTAQLARQRQVQPSVDCKNDPEGARGHVIDSTAHKASHASACDQRGKQFDIRNPRVLLNGDPSVVLVAIQVINHSQRQRCFTQ